MKNLISIAFILFLFYQNGVSQTESQVIKYSRLVFDGNSNDFWKQQEKGYIYDDFGNVIFLEKKTYEFSGIVETWRGLFYTYDENQLLQQLKYRQYKESVDLWITDFWYEYKYDDNGCLVDRNFISNLGGEGVKNKIEYERDNACQIISTSHLNRSTINEPFILNTYETRDYHADGISYDFLEFKHSPTGDTLYLKYEEKFIFNEFEKVTEHFWKAYNEEQTVFNFWKDTYEYDDYGNLIFKKGYIKYQDTAEWALSTELNYYLEYDENGFLIESRKEYFSHATDPPTPNPNFSRTIDYKNSCEGFPEEINSVYDTGVRIKEKNIFKGINECLDVESLDLQILISPNPTHGEIKITSPIFQTGNTDVLVFTTNGKVLLQENEQSRCEVSSIDLTSLQNGIYILQLQNGKHFVNEKIVIAN
ncbi:MAG: T9SS type A sorting domain-containing protein [Saprospiraceae bacterium]